MSFGPPKDGRPYVPTAKRVHRLSERFPKTVDEARRDKHRDTLTAKLHAHLTSPASGLSWLDALLYERLFSDKVVPFAPSAGLARTAVGTSASHDCIDPAGFWCPTVATLERLVEMLDTQDALRRRCIAAVRRRNEVLEKILSSTCYAARRFEQRERDVRRSLSGLGSSPNLLQQQSSSGGSFSPSHKTSPTRSSSRGGRGGYTLQPLSLMQLWPNDVTRQYLQRVSLSGFDACNLPKPHVNCSVASHKQLAELLEELDGATDDVVGLVILWRLQLNRPLPFVFGGHNVILMIQNELETLVTSITSHLTEQAGGQAMYTAKECPFHYVSRYAGGTGAVSSLHASSHRESSAVAGGAGEPRARHQPPINQHIAKTMAHTVGRELSTQLKLVEAGGRLAEGRGFHVPPLGNYLVSLAGSDEAGESGSKLGLKEHSSLPSSPCHPDEHRHTSSKHKDASSSSVPAPTSQLPPFVLEARGDPAAVRKYVQRVGRPIVSLPIIVQAPKKWFCSECTAPLGDDDECVEHPGTLLDEMKHDLEAAYRELTGDKNASVSLEWYGRGSIISPTGAASAAARSASLFSGSHLLPPIPLADGRTMHGARHVPSWEEDSAFVPVVVLDTSGFLTNGGMHFLLHREVDREGPVVIERTRQWLRECYTQGRIILEEPFGSVVEPHMQQRAFEHAEEAAILAKEEQQALMEGRKPRSVRDLIRHKRSRSVVPTEDFGTDEKLDKLVLVAYRSGAAVRTPPPSAKSRVGSALQLQQSSISVVPSGTHEPAAVGELLMDDQESLNRLVVLQRRSVKRFGLRILRSWLRFHMHRVHRNEITVDLLEKNMFELLRRRYTTWLKLTQRRRSARQRAEDFRRATERRFMRRRFGTWRVVLLSRAVAQNFNQWLYRASYFRWLYLVLRKRVKQAVLNDKAGRPWLSAMAQCASLVGRRNLDAMLLIASLPPSRDADHQQVGGSVHTPLSTAEEL